jgi:hypothetical protein
MLVKRSTAFIVAALLATAVSTVTGFMVAPGGYLAPLAGPPLVGANEGIVGTISIGNIYPLCTGNPTTAPAPEYDNQIEVVITPSPSSDFPLTVPVNWVLLNGCTVHGTFKVGLNPGAYSLTLTSCLSQPNSFGCSELPRLVTVEPNTWTPVDILVTTGIY